MSYVFVELIPLGAAAVLGVVEVTGRPSRSYDCVHTFPFASVVDVGSPAASNTVELDGPDGGADEDVRDYAALQQKSHRADLEIARGTTTRKHERIRFHKTLLPL